MKGGMTSRLLLAALLALAPAPALARPTVPPLARLPGQKPRNVVFILADDHRYDAMGFMGHPWLETPHMDAMARQGAHLANAFVTTALCSPSRASILTGLYTHRHQVVDNNHPVKKDTVFFPQYLERAGYQTAFFGKWHMGDSGDAPQPGFSHWVSFAGQGAYAPDGQTLNVNGTRVPRRGYITDELTDHALDWLEKRDRRRPFFLYLSHKGVHADFVPAERHKDTYATKRFAPPHSFPRPGHELVGVPRWVQDQRNSWHGVDYPYHSRMDVEGYYRRYAETLLAVDESLGRVMAALDRAGLLASTLIIYMGDNGFSFGEHGLIDKRTAYEESMRVPMLAHCPELIRPGTTVHELSANIDVAPTVLAAAGLVPPAYMDGASLLPLLRGERVPWRTEFLYQYYWERNYPQTPTLFALRGERYKYIRQHGLWDIDELYDLATDPHETKNLIFDPAHAALAKTFNERLWALLERTGAMSLPLQPDAGRIYNHRSGAGARPGQFDPRLVDGDAGGTALRR